MSEPFKGLDPITMTADERQDYEALCAEAGEAESLRELTKHLCWWLDILTKGREEHPQICLLVETHTGRKFADWVEDAYGDFAAAAEDAADRRLFG